MNLHLYKIPCIHTEGKEGNFVSSLPYQSFEKELMCFDDMIKKNQQKCKTLFGICDEIIPNQTLLIAICDICKNQMI